MVASKSIRYSLLQSLGGKQPDKQSEVWRDVAKEQNKLSATTGQDLKSSQSASSYQLTLEHKKLQEELKEFKARLRPVIDKHPDVIGFAYRINGKFSNANVYGSSKLFKKLWPKLLDAASTEAIAETSKDYKGKVLKDVGENAKDNDKSVAGNEWMNALFVDGHVDGKRVDLEKGNKFYIKDEKDGIRNMTTNGGKVLRFNYEAK